MQVLEKAQRPVVLAGAGVIVAEAAAELNAFIAKYKLPTVTTLLGLGLLPSDHQFS